MLTFKPKIHLPSLIFKEVKEIIVILSGFNYKGDMFSLLAILRRENKPRRLLLAVNHTQSHLKGWLSSMVFCIKNLGSILLQVTSVSQQ